MFTKATEPKTLSVVPERYRALYAATNGRCGDEIADLVSAHVRGADGRVDLEALRRFAEANGCWQPRYSELNPGMQRMNVVNRLRSKMRKGHEVVWA